MMEIIFEFLKSSAAPIILAIVSVVVTIIIGLINVIPGFLQILSAKKQILLFNEVKQLNLLNDFVKFINDNGGIKEIISGVKSNETFHYLNKMRSLNDPKLNKLLYNLNSAQYAAAASINEEEINLGMIECFSLGKTPYHMHMLYSFCCGSSILNINEEISLHKLSFIEKIKTIKYGSYTCIKCKSKWLRKNNTFCWRCMNSTIIKNKNIFGKEIW